MNRITRQILKYAGIALLFLILSYAFVPQVLGGKIVNQSDISGFQGMAHEMTEWNKTHPDDPAYWTGSMFSGMPTTTISAPKQGDRTQELYDLLLTGKRPATYLFVSLVGAFLLMLSMGISLPIAVGGAIAITFCAYNFQIIQVGHNTKMQAIAFLPWVLAALIFTYRSALEKSTWKKKTVLGAILFAFALSFQIKANHPQITYYLALMILIFAVAELISVIRSSERRVKLGRFFAASSLLLLLGMVGIATNANKLIPIYKYTPYSMRGGSELSSGQDAAQQKGLDIDYATAWSYGWEELPNLFIPNFNGGSSSAAVNPDKSATIDLLKRAGQSNVREVAKGLPMYWGPQPFTAGPMYMGAVTVFLFLLGLMLCRGRRKWWLLAATLLAILLALGSHLLWFTKIFYDYAPFYNKFRTVSMALVVLQFTLPMLGFYALDRIARGQVDAAEFKLKGSIAAMISGGFALLLFLAPSIAGSFTGAVDQGQPDVLVDAFREDRRVLLTSDALRSLLLVVATYALLVWSYWGGNAQKQTQHRHIAALLVCVLALVDMFTVGKRYLNADDFISPKAFRSQFDLRPADSAILEDKDLSYRVIDLSVNTFNDSHPSWWHKNIGGYSPAKLQRYQDLIEHYIQPEIRTLATAMQGVATVSELQDSLPELPILSALNTRYIIVGGDISPVRNEHAYGNAWFVSEIVPAASPDEELAKLSDVNLLQTAVIGRDFADGVGELTVEDADDKIELTYYSPNELRYHYTLNRSRLAVFSEVFYPEGWNAWLDGDKSAEVSVLRADWVLRAAMLPAGEHDLTMRFEPHSISSSITISKISSIFLLTTLFLMIGISIEPKYKKRKSCK